MIKELPGDVLVAYRESRGHIRDVSRFADLAGSNYSKIHRLESIRWGTPPSEWSGVFDVADLDIFIDAEMMAVGDNWHRRFQDSFVWQAQAMQHGEAIYEEIEPDSSHFAPISLEHLSVVVSAVIEKMGEEGYSTHLEDEHVRAAVASKLYEAVRLTLEVVGLLLRRDEGDEITRGPLPDLTGVGGVTESPYVHTLRFAVRCASAYAREQLAGRLAAES